MKKSINFIVVILIAAIFSCDDNITQVQTFVKKDDHADISVEKVESIYTEKGEIIGKLISPELVRFTYAAEPYTEFPKGIKLVTFDSDFNESSSLTANYARLDEKTEIWVYKDDVKLKNTRGEILRTELLYADQNKEIIYTDKFVRITNSYGTDIKGAGGFEANLDFSKYSFKDVSGRVMLEN